MLDLPARPDLDQLRRQAKELLRAATGGDADALRRVQAVSGGDADALRRVQAVSDRLVLASAQLAVAREYGFESWPRLHPSKASPARAKRGHDRVEALLLAATA